MKRRSSLLEGIKSPLTASNELPLINNDITDRRSIPNDLDSTPFELNTSIWSPPNSASLSGDGNSRLSINEFHTHHEKQASLPLPPSSEQDHHVINYTTWSNPDNNNYMNNVNLRHSFSNGSDTSKNNQARITSPGLEELNGLSFNSFVSPRRYSLDSYTNTYSSNNNVMGHSSQGWFQNDQQQQFPSSQQTTLGNPPKAINESTPQLTQYYKQLDFYYTQDPYRRISISSDSLSTNSVESLLMFKSPNSSASGGSITLPKFQNASLPSQQLVLISFKSGRIDVFYLPENSSLVLKIGDLVIVEADRGKDLGKVIKLDVSIDEARLLKYLQFMEQQAALSSFDAGNSNTNNNNNGNGNNNNNNNVPTLHFPKPILRLALPQEILQIFTKLSDEEKAKKICLFKIESFASQLNGEMHIIDAEYQFDRRKLTFYYTASHRIDFRDLVRDLFRVYKTRIWMCAVNSQHVIIPSDDKVSSPLTNPDVGFNQYIWNTNSSPPLSSSSLSPSQINILSSSFTSSNVINNDNNVNNNGNSNAGYFGNRVSDSTYIPKNDFGTNNDINALASTNSHGSSGNSIWN